MKEDSAVMVAIPDVHGRTFWREAVERHKDLPVVFLGDYLDPYYDEDISREDALNEFKSILEYKKENPDRVTLLFGNHDIHYLCVDFEATRKDRANEEEIRNLFQSNLSLFHMASCFKTGEREFLFTHAGVLSGWYLQYFPKETLASAELICNSLNGKMEDEQTWEIFLRTALTDVSMYRYGGDLYGSCVWADVREYPKDRETIKGVYQVFGHTQLREGPFISSYFADLDCRKAFVITESGNIMPVS